MAEFNAPVSSDDRARLDELFADLTDESQSVPPITAEERSGRRARLGRLLDDHGFDAMLVEGGTTLSYLTGVAWGLSERLFALIVTADGDHFWIVPGFERERAELLTADAAGEIVTWQEHEYPYAPLASALAARDCERLAFEPWVRYRFVHEMARELGESRVSIGHEALVELRGSKDEHEIAILRRANELTQRAIVRVSETLEPGVTSSEIGRRLTVAQERLGLKEIWNLSLIGPAAAYPHGDGREGVLADGDLVLVDSGGFLHGYGSDNTRTWVQGGKPGERVESIWHTVRDAQKAAFEAIEPGVACGEIDNAARNVIDRAGFGTGYSAFFHRLGHGIGMSVHEDPYFDGGSDVRLARGMTFSNEPGIYLPGELGLRIEDIVCVTEYSADHFGSWQAGPASPHPE